MSSSKVAILLVVSSSLFQIGSCWQQNNLPAFISSTTISNNCRSLPLVALQMSEKEAGEQQDLPLKDKASSIDLEDPKLTDKGLPELKGDFDWDEKFGDDDDWITENVPGKIVLNEVELAKQVTALNKLETQWRREREIKEYEESLKVGWVPEAELLNGRFAMFFLVTGLLTEYWTGYSMPQQVEEMLRIGGFIGPDM